MINKNSKNKAVPISIKFLKGYSKGNYSYPFYPLN